MYNGVVAEFATLSQLFGTTKYVLSAYDAGIFLSNLSWNVMNKIMNGDMADKEGVSGTRTICEIFERVKSAPLSHNHQLL